MTGARLSTPELDALDDVSEWARTGLTNVPTRDGEFEEVAQKVALIRAALPPGPVDPDACVWCQEGKHYNCSGARRVEGDRVGQATGVCDCRHGGEK